MATGGGDGRVQQLEHETWALDYVCREWGRKLDEAQKRIEELEAEAEGDPDAEPVCKYKSCPEEQHELAERQKRTRWLDYAAGLAQGLTTVGVIWLLIQAVFPEAPLPPPP
jgi:hypothetical protein